MLVEITGLDELALDHPVAVQIGDCDLIVVRTSSGWYALDNHCPHQSLPLVDSAVRDDLLTCRHHGVQIAVADGAIVSAMGLLYLEPVATYQLTRKGDRLFVELD